MFQPFGKPDVLLVEWIPNNRPKSERPGHIVHFAEENGRWWAWCKCGWIDCHSDRETLSGIAVRHDIRESA